MALCLTEFSCLEEGDKAGRAENADFRAGPGETGSSKKIVPCFTVLV